MTRGRYESELHVSFFGGPSFGLGLKGTTKGKRPIFRVPPLLRHAHIADPGAGDTSILARVEREDSGDPGAGVRPQVAGKLVTNGGVNSLLVEGKPEGGWMVGCMVGWLAGWMDAWLVGGWVGELVGLGWVGLGWVGLGWVGLGWVGWMVETPPYFETHTHTYTRTVYCKRAMHHPIRHG